MVFELLSLAAVVWFQEKPLDTCNTPVELILSHMMITHGNLTIAMKQHILHSHIQLPYSGSNKLHRHTHPLQCRRLYIQYTPWFSNKALQ